MGLRAILQEEARNQALKEREAAAEKKRRQGEKERDKDAKFKKQAREEAEQNAKYAELLFLRVLYEESGVGRSLLEIKTRHKGEIEEIWDGDRGIYGQRVLWDKKLDEKSRRGEHYIHPGGLLSPGWYWGKEVGIFHAKAIEVTISAQRRAGLAIAGKKRKEVDRHDKREIDIALGEVYQRPAKISRVEHVKK